MKKIIHDDDCSMEAINDRTGDRYNKSWLKTKLVLYRNTSTVDARQGY